MLQLILIEDVTFVYEAWQHLIPLLATFCHKRFSRDKIKCLSKLHKTAVCMFAFLFVLEDNTVMRYDLDSSDYSENHFVHLLNPIYL